MNIFHKETYDNKIYLSIITICLNSECTIGDNIHSVNNQTFQNFEQIFIDGKSSDLTVPLIKKLTSVNYSLVSERDSGIYHAMNKGIMLAKGKYIMFLNSDDILDNNLVLQTLFDATVKNNSDVLISNIRYVDRSELTKVIRVWKTSRYELSNLRYGWMPPHPGTLIRRSLVNELGGFKQKYKISGDYDLLVRLLKTPNLVVHFTNSYSTKMRVGGISNSSIKNILEKMFEDYKVIRENKIGNIFTLFCKSLRKITQFL